MAGTLRDCDVGNHKCYPKKSFSVTRLINALVKINYDVQSFQHSRYSALLQSGYKNFDLAAVSNKIASKHVTINSMFGKFSANNFT